MIFKRKPDYQQSIAASLTQIYGELNRIRLSMPKTKRGEYIINFDKEHNNYAPFIDDPSNFKKYHEGNKK